MTTKMENLFERLLSETDSGNATPAERAALHSAIAIAHAHKVRAQDGDATERLAAYLDGALEPEDAERFAASLAGAPDEVYELEGALSFLDEIAAQRESAPADLVAAAAADVAREARRSSGRSWFLNSASWGRHFAWAGGAAATVLLGVVIIDRAGEIVADPTVAMIAAPTPVEASVSPDAPMVLVTPALPAVAAPPINVVTGPSTDEARPAQRLAQQNAPRIDAQPRDRRNEPETSRLVDSGQAGNAGQPPASPTPSAEQDPARGARPPAPVGVAPPPPPAAARAEKVDETVLRTGSLIRGTAAVGVPVAQPAPRPPPGYYAGGVVSDLVARVAPGISQQNTERYPGGAPNAVKVVRNEPVSTFSLDVDTASYANVRRYLNQGVLPPVDAVRVEEMVNYFDYAYLVPRDRSVPFLPSVAVYPSPWNADTQILHVGIKGFDLPRSERPKANLVFLIDTSGSMNEPAKLPLVKRSFQLLLDQLRPEDRVSIVVYAGSAGMVLEPTPGWDKDKILGALDRLQAGGSTAGGEGIRQAYDLAKANFDRNGVNRVLLATDGDFNVGITDPKMLEDFIARERASGVFLSVLGFGGGNYNDLLMQKLAQAGNGTAAYVDTLSEARKVFVDELGSTLFTIAKDVKVQVEFNPARVAEYRLIGYETRMLNQTDFNNDKVDAGDVGSGHTVTALYEITPVGSRALMSDPLRYRAPAPDERSAQSEIAFVKIRYKLPNEDESKLITRPVANADVVPEFNALPVDYRFAAAVAGSAQLLRHDPYIKSFDYDRAMAIAQGARGDDEFGYRNEFVQMLRSAQTAASLQAAASSNRKSGQDVVYTAPNPPRRLTTEAVTADDYPPASLRLQEQGTVRIKYVVETNGSVGECEVVTSSGFPRLDDAGCSLVKRRWKFSPATALDGRPIAIWQEDNVRFQLR